MEIWVYPFLCYPWCWYVCNGIFIFMYVIFLYFVHVVNALVCIPCRNKSIYLSFYLSLVPSRLHIKIQRATMRECENTMATVRQYNDDSATIRWRQYDMTIALSPSYYRTVAIKLLHCRHRTIAFSHSRHRILALSSSFSRTRVILFSQSHIVAFWI